MNPFGLYDAQFTLDVGMVFYINLACTLVVLLCFGARAYGLWPGVSTCSCGAVCCATPALLLVLGIAGILNQTLDKIIFPYLYDGADDRRHSSAYMVRRRRLR